MNPKRSWRSDKGESDFDNWKCLSLGAQQTHTFEKRSLEPIFISKNEPNPFLFQNRPKPISLKVRTESILWTSSVRGRPDISINCGCSVTWCETAKAVSGNCWLIRCWNQLFKRYSKTKNTNATSKWTNIHYKDYDSKSTICSSLRWGKSETKKCDASATLPYFKETKYRTLSLGFVILYSL